MKKMIKPFAAICMVALTFTACKKEVATVAEDEISQETLSKISNLGFGTSNVQKIDEGYLVEGDIILSEGQLNETPNSPILRIAEEEQYRTNNLVTGLPRTITVSVSGTVNSGFSSAVDAAIARYNTENLQLKFQRVSSGGAINIRLVNTGQYIASAGFPSGGNPYPEIKYANRYTSYSAGFMTTVLAHEMGHCIGFRHTDYMNRAYSCGSGGNEGASTVGAVHIPGTPTGPDAASWMLACLSASTNRPFNSNDKVALNYLY
ncbi:MAG TPA: M57 family metalloprotease [Flavisolibacter sp.]|nr:M57 family metalloprotease [Flavisolibacter sp.]